MSRILLLVANDPPLARETIATALQERRPDLDTMVVDPMQLEERIERVHPDLVICSELTRTVETAVPSWVLLDPRGSDAVTNVGGRRQETAQLCLGDLLDVVDQTARLGPPLPVADAGLLASVQPERVRVRYWPQVMTRNDAALVGGF